MNFNKYVKIGEFASGDPFIVTSSSLFLEGISPGYEVIDGREINGATLNIECGIREHGFDSSLSGYVESRNVAKKLFNGDSVELHPGDRLIVSISNKDLTTSNHVSRLERIYVLVVLSEEPEETMFRPGYCKEKWNQYINSTISSPYNEYFTEKFYRVKDIVNEDLLQNLNVPSSTTIPSFDYVQSIVGRGWFEFGNNYMNRYEHPSWNMPAGNYGREIASATSIGAMYVHLNISSDLKKPILHALVQNGIDYYYSVMNGGHHMFANNGGHESGRKFMIIFSGIMLNESRILRVGALSGDYMYGGTSKNYSGDPRYHPDDYIHFGEEDQTFYVSSYDIALSNSDHFNPDDRAAGLFPYNSTYIHMPEWSIRRATYEIDYVGNADWSATYRTCCNAVAWQGFILSMRLLGEQGKKAWNHDALFDFVDRYMGIESTEKKDPFGYVVPHQYTASGSYRCTSSFCCGMWDEYRY